MKGESESWVNIVYYQSPSVTYTGLKQIIKWIAPVLQLDCCFIHDNPH